MKTFIKTLVCAFVVSVAFLACELDLSSASLAPNNPPLEGTLNVPAMNSNVVSYQRPLYWYSEALISEYGNGLTTDEEVLKLWFPNIFTGEQTDPECNYFALYFTNSSSGLTGSYEVLSQDMTLHYVACTWKHGNGVSTCDFAKRAMLICDDKDWTLKSSIDLDAMMFYNDPNWDCESGAGGPDWEKVYF